MICPGCRKERGKRFPPRAHGTMLCSYCQAELRRANEPGGAAAFAERRRERRLTDRARKYQLTADQLRSLYTDQQDRCAICRASYSLDVLHIDHDHTTGAVRGLLCNSCNTGLGHLGDTIEGLQRAIAYLDRTAPMSPSGPRVSQGIID